MDDSSTPSVLEMREQDIETLRETNPGFVAAPIADQLRWVISSWTEWESEASNTSRAAYYRCQFENRRALLIDGYDRLLSERSRGVEALKAAEDDLEQSIADRLREESEALTTEAALRASEARVLELESALTKIAACEGDPFATVRATMAARITLASSDKPRCVDPLGRTSSTHAFIAHDGAVTRCSSCGALASSPSPKEPPEAAVSPSSTTSETKTTSEERIEELEDLLKGIRSGWDDFVRTGGDLTSISEAIGAARIAARRKTDVIATRGSRPARRAAGHGHGPSVLPAAPRVGNHAVSAPSETPCGTITITPVDATPSATTPSTPDERAT